MSPEPETGLTPIELRPIGVIHSCFPDKFGIPRQPGLVPEAEARLELLPPYNRVEAVRGLEDCSHVWILFLFHHCLRDDWRPTVRPPRLGGERRLGVFATRAPYRPNPIGLSAVALLGIDNSGGRVELRLGGIDLADGTPVLDIKPYLPYADSLPEARVGFGEAEPADLELAFAPQPEALLAALPQAEGRRLRSLISGLLRQDPRPAHQTGDTAGRGFGMRLEGLDIRWECLGNRFLVTRIEPWGSRDRPSEAKTKR